jgi:DNA polymerase II large subunit
MIEDYFKVLQDGFERANAVASKAKSRGFDPKETVEIRPAPDLASRVEEIIGMEGLARLIKERSDGKGRELLAFDIAKELCTNPKYDIGAEKRLTLAVRTGLAILTEGVVVAPTEGIQGVELHRNADRSDYVSVLYAGPIRGAGGTSAALSVAIADYGRRLMGIGAYKATQSEIDRYVEEIQLYDSKCAHLQYMPSEQDVRLILSNCPVCIDGVPTERVDMVINRNIKRLDASGKEQIISNKVRGGICLVTCEGVAQKAKSVLKHTRNAGLDWSWLNGIIKVEKPTLKIATKDKHTFLQELVAGRPIFAYPEHSGAFRLRYGRSRLTGIAAKGISPATMIVLDNFIAYGTQLKVEKPGKGCVAAPVDTIEGPFVKLTTGEALRINTAEQARELTGKISKILSVGDILITYGDFKKTNTQLLPSSYVEEFWRAQLEAAGSEEQGVDSFRRAFELSEKYGVPMHPLYTYDYNDITPDELVALARTLAASKIQSEDGGLFGVESVTTEGADAALVDALERLCIPHFSGSSIIIKGGHAQSLLATLGFTKNGKLGTKSALLEGYDTKMSTLEIVNSVAPFKVMRRSTRIGGRMGRPEKARERLMKPAPYFLFPIGEHGGKERNVSKAYGSEKVRFGNRTIEVEIARYRCQLGDELVAFPFCTKHSSKAKAVRICGTCGRETDGITCSNCGGTAVGYQTTSLDIASITDMALANLELHELPKNLRGVKGLMNRDKTAEPMEKGILRAIHNVHIFKDGTARFDATDIPMTHFYPKEIMVDVDKLRGMGYANDYMGNELKDDSQLVELKHQDVVINRSCAEHMLNIAKFVDDLLVRYYRLEPFYNANSIQDLVGHFVITLAPHTSAGVLCRVIGFTDAKVGLAHPYVISARRRNCDGDEDTTMLLLDALVNFSRSYLPITIGGTMDAPLILTINVKPEEVDDEVHDMEVVREYGLDFYNKTLEYVQPGEVSIELVRDRLKDGNKFDGLNFTQLSGIHAIEDSPRSSSYTTLNTMQDKIDLQFKLMDRLYSVDKADTARRVVLSHFIPDLIGNMHSFSGQSFRCVACNAKYRRVPLVGKCTKCGGKIVLTISKGSIEKYLNMAIDLATRYGLEPYIKQRLLLAKDEIENVFGGTIGEDAHTKQFNLAKFI